MCAYADHQTTEINARGRVSAWRRGEVRRESKSAGQKPLEDAKNAADLRFTLLVRPAVQRKWDLIESRPSDKRIGHEKRWMVIQLPNWTYGFVGPSEEKLLPSARVARLTGGRTKGGKHLSIVRNPLQQNMK